MLNIFKRLQIIRQNKHQHESEAFKAGFDKCLDYLDIAIHAHPQYNFAALNVKICAEMEEIKQKLADKRFAYNKKEEQYKVLQQQMEKTIAKNTELIRIISELKQPYIREKIPVNKQTKRLLSLLTNYENNLKK